MKQPELVTVSVRITRDLADRLKIVADREDRAVAAEIRRLIRERVDQAEAA